ncbi:hypothetical protein ACQP1W_43155 [Spirillospora sp. CA-255316]
MKGHAVRTRKKARGNVRPFDVWARERALDPDGAWLRDTYGLEAVERDLLKRAVESGEAAPGETLRGPAAEYARRVLERPWWNRSRAWPAALGVGLGVGLGFGTVPGIASVAGVSVGTERIVVGLVYALVTLCAVLVLARRRTARLRRAERLNGALDGGLNGAEDGA